MPTRNFYFPGSRRANYSELSAAPLDESTTLAHQRDNGTDNGHGVKPRPQDRPSSEDYTMLNGVEKLNPTATADKAYREDVGLLERATPRQERKRQTQASSLPRTATVRAPADDINQSYTARTTAQTALSQEELDLDILLNRLFTGQPLPVKRRRPRALPPPPVPLVPKEKPSKASFLERLNPFRRIRSLSTPPAHRAIVCVPSENSGLARRRSLARRG